MRRAIDISDALCWPSGYYAKTEHNMEVDERSGRVLLATGRAAGALDTEGDGANSIGSAVAITSCTEYGGRSRGHDGG